MTMFTKFLLTYIYYLQMVVFAVPIVQLLFSVWFEEERSAVGLCRQYGDHFPKCCHFRGTINDENLNYLLLSKINQYKSHISHCRSCMPPLALFPVTLYLPHSKCYRVWCSCAASFWRRRSPCSRPGYRLPSSPGRWPKLFATVSMDLICWVLCRAFWCGFGKCPWPGASNCSSMHC